MNRRDALLAILLVPSGYTSLLVQQKKEASTGQLIDVLSPAARLVMNLVDKEDSEQGGIFELQVWYKGNVQKFSAKEIWEALQGPEELRK